MDSVKFTVVQASTEWENKLSVTMHNIKNPLPFSLTNLEFLREPQHQLERMRAEGSIIPVKMPFVGRIWVTTTYAATEQVMKGKDTFFLEGRSVGKTKIAGLPWWIPKSLNAITENMLSKDEPDHRRLRKLVDLAFRRHSVLDMRSLVESRAEALLDRIPTKEFDLNNNFARKLPLEIISDLLGVSEKYREIFAKEALHLTENRLIFIPSIVLGMKRLIKMIRELIADARQAPSKGLLKEMLDARDEQEKLSEDELVSMVFLLLFAGMDTTRNLIAGSVWALQNSPTQKDWLLKNFPERRESAVEELTRHVSSVGGTKPRYVGHDIEIEGQALKKGEKIMALPVAANYDPLKFKNPEHLTLNRFPNPHLSFSAGIHFCLGLQLARVEVQAALEVLYRRYPNLTCSPPSYLRRPGIRSIKKCLVLID